MSSQDQTLKGSCYCGACAFSLSNVTDDQKGGVFCHCKTCQKISSDRSFNVQVSRDQLKLEKGEPTIFLDQKTDSGKPVRRFFCPSCGSALYSLPDLKPEAALVKVGVLECASTIKPVAEIYIESGIPQISTNQALDIKHFVGLMSKEVDTY